MSRYFNDMPFDARRWWTPEDIAALVFACQLGGNLGALSRMLGRPAKDVVYKARRLGLQVPDAWRGASKAYLKRCVEDERNAPVPLAARTTTAR